MDEIVAHPPSSLRHLVERLYENTGEAVESQQFLLYHRYNKRRKARQPNFDLSGSKSPPRNFVSLSFVLFLRSQLTPLVTARQGVLARVRVKWFLAWRVSGDAVTVFPTS